MAAIVGMLPATAEVTIIAPRILSALPIRTGKTLNAVAQHSQIPRKLLLTGRFQLAPRFTPVAQGTQEKQDGESIKRGRKLRGRQRDGFVNQCVVDFSTSGQKCTIEQRHCLRPSGIRDTSPAPGRRIIKGIQHGRQ